MYSAPPPNYNGPPPGYNGPPPGYNGPPSGYNGPPSGYSGPQQQGGYGPAAAGCLYNTNPSPNATQEKRVLYVGNLAPECSEPVLVAVFQPFGQCVACKMIRNQIESYAFLEFSTHQQAQIALTAMNHITLMDRELRVNWATTPGQKPDPTKGSNVFVGDLVVDVEESELEDVFIPFGPIVDIKIVRNSDGNNQKTFAFITFENEEDAETSIASLNGTLLRHKPMKVSQATRKNAGATPADANRKVIKRSYDDVYSEASLYNTTAYVGGIQQGLDENLIRTEFDDFGPIVDMKLFPDKGFAFVRFENHDAATRAIVNRQGTNINGYTVKVSWGKEHCMDNHGNYTPPTKLMKKMDGAPTIGPTRPGMGPSAAGPPPSGGGAPDYSDPAYQKYYQEYMEWYRKYGQQYYAQQQQ